MNRRDGLQEAILDRLAAGPATVAQLWQHALDADIDCIEETIRRNLRQLAHQGLVEHQPESAPQTWALTGAGAETAEIGRFVP